MIILTLKNEFNNNKKIFIILRRRTFTLLIS